MPSPVYTVAEVDALLADVKQQAEAGDTALAIYVQQQIAGHVETFHPSDPDPEPPPEPPPPPPPPVEVGTLLVSAYPDRLNPVELQGALLNYRHAYVFYVPGEEENPQRVQFFLDGQDWHTEHFTPYDFAGGNVTEATPWNTDTIPAGPHTIRVVETRPSGVTIETTVNFRTEVMVEPEPPPDPNPPPPEPEPGDEWVPRAKPDGFVTVPTDATGAWFETQTVRSFWFEGVYTRLHEDGGIRVRPGDNYLGNIIMGPTSEHWTLPDGSVVYGREKKAGTTKLVGPSDDVNRVLGPADADTYAATLFYVQFGTSVENVTIRGLEVTGYPCWHGNYATGQYLRVDSQTGLGVSQLSPFGNQGGMVNWTIDHVWSHHNPYGNGLRANRGCVISNVLVNDNGNMGIGAGGASGLDLSLYELRSNTKHRMLGFESGGIKVTTTTGGSGHHGLSRFNHGTGLWTDISNVGFTWESNVVLDNFGRGIFHEISGPTVIRNNVVARNGKPGSTGWGYRGQIVISASRGEAGNPVLVAANEIVMGEIASQHGITLIQQGRGDYYLDHVRIEGNRVIRLATGSGVHRGFFDDTGGIYDNVVDPEANPNDPDAQDNRFGHFFPGGMVDLVQGRCGHGHQYGNLKVPPRFGDPSGRVAGETFVETWTLPVLTEAALDLIEFNRTEGRLKMVYTEEANTFIG